MWLFILLLAVPIIEIALFVELGGALGLGWTLAIVFVTALLGFFLLRQQGMQTAQSLRSSMAEGRNPMSPIAHGALLVVAAILLMTPGFFTDAVGLSLTLPPVRSWLIKAGASRVSVKTMGFGVEPEPDRERERPRNAADDVIDGDFTVDEQAEPGSSGWTRRP